MSTLLNQLIAEVQEQIDEVKPMAMAGRQPDKYSHGWYTGNFATWVEMRRRLKEIRANTPSEGDVLP